MIKTAAHSFSVALINDFYSTVYLITLITESVFVRVPSLGQSQNNISLNPLTALNVLVEAGPGVFSPECVCVCVCIGGAYDLLSELLQPAGGGVTEGEGGVSLDVTER